MILCFRIYCAFCTWRLICTPTSSRLPPLFILWLMSMKVKIIWLYAKRGGGAGAPVWQVEVSGGAVPPELFVFVYDGLGRIVYMGCKQRGRYPEARPHWPNLIINVLTGSQSSGRGRGICWWSSGTSGKDDSRVKGAKGASHLGEIVHNKTNPVFLTFQRPVSVTRACYCGSVVPVVCCHRRFTDFMICWLSILMILWWFWWNMGNIVQHYWNSREVSLNLCVFGCVRVRVCVSV